MFLAPHDHHVLCSLSHMATVSLVPPEHRVPCPLSHLTSHPMTGPCIPLNQGRPASHLPFDSQSLHSYIGARLPCRLGSRDNQLATNSSAQLSSAQLGSSRRGPARLGSAWPGSVWLCGIFMTLGWAGGRAGSRYMTGCPDTIRPLRSEPRDE